MSGMKYRDLAHAIGVSVSAVSSYLMGLRLPKLETFIRIAEALHTTPNFLLGFDMYARDIHSSIPTIVNILKDKSHLLTMSEKEEIMAALIGQNLRKGAHQRV